MREPEVLCGSFAVCKTLRGQNSWVLGRKGMPMASLPRLPSIDWELSRLQRRYKVMEMERQAYSKEVHQRIKKQL